MEYITNTNAVRVYYNNSDLASQPPQWHCIQHLNCQPFKLDAVQGTRRIRIIADNHALTTGEIYPHLRETKRSVAYTFDH